MTALYEFNSPEKALEEIDRRLAEAMKPAQINGNKPKLMDVVERVKTNRNQ